LYSPACDQIPSFMEPSHPGDSQNNEKCNIIRHTD
jgi:hypothetical protein